MFQVMVIYRPHSPFRSKYMLQRPQLGLRRRMLRTFQENLDFLGLSPPAKGQEQREGAVRWVFQREGHGNGISPRDRKFRVVRDDPYASAHEAGNCLTVECGEVEVALADSAAAWEVCHL